MEGFTAIDGIVAAVIVVSGILAYSRGFVREAMAILGWIVAAVVAFTFAAQAEPLMQEIPMLGDFLADSCQLSIIAAFAAVFALALVVMSIFTPLMSSIVQGTLLRGLDQGAGFLFGALRGLALVALAFFVYDTVNPTQDIPMVDNSQSAAIFERVTERIREQDPDKAWGWLTGYYEKLVGHCDAPE
ncbi:CvpA family protein [Rhodovulum adriaticum]|uniref:Membrane protein required for colicin V production n=1 Tax=Rhodovulum adriaticum TaxID=35804 RepID=A0A4R2NVQ6_RHOAD|nr:CvpA family protein [Rhodovulum adriaticum]MBK1635695.1 colicin V production CvpA [Rhodovulum adriaticum]TCP26203.1 membrane protein required for colicin V production [Rhodovulum adriaticum]